MKPELHGLWIVGFSSLLALFYGRYGKLNFTPRILVVPATLAAIGVFYACAKWWPVHAADLSYSLIVAQSVLFLHRIGRDRYDKIERRKKIEETMLKESRP